MANESYSFFALAFRQKYIRRWGLMRSTIPENLSEHSSETALIAHALAVIGNTYFGKNYDCGKVAAAALFHDITEIFTGDLPTPVKYFNDSMRESYRQIENDAANKLTEKLPPPMQSAYTEMMNPTDADTIRLVKTADKLCAYIKCVEEVKGGNGEFANAEKSVYQSIIGYDSPELSFFLENFLPPFTGTLDEM
jgi:5'-deoxynucleotidase